MPKTSRADGFDEFAEEVRGADVTIVLTGPSHSGWRLERYLAGDVLLQFAYEAGERVLYGRAAADQVSFATRASFDPVGERMNGRPFGGCDFAIIPPGADFLFSCSKPHEWIGVSLPSDSIRRQGHPLEHVQSLCLSATSMLINVSAPACQRFRQAAFAARAEFRQPGQAAVGVSADHAEPVIGSLVAAIDNREKSHDAPADRLRDDERLVHRALRRTAREEWRGPPIEQMAAALGVSERTLLRAFENVLGMSTSQFLKKWKLNIVRREIIANPEKYKTITRLLSEHGVSELGRFAGEYRSLFGETPSETLSGRRRDVETTAGATALHPAALALRMFEP